MKKFALLSVIGASMILTGCGYPTLSEFSDEDHSLISEIQYKKKFSDDFWREWQKKAKHTEEIRNVLEKNRIIENNKISSHVHSDIVLSFLDSRSECKKDSYLGEIKYCYIPIDKLAETMTDLFSVK